MLLLAGSLDGIFLVSDHERYLHIAYIEIKKIVALGTIENSRKTRAKRSAHVVLQNISHSMATL